MLLVTAFTAKHLPVGTCFTQGDPFQTGQVYKPWLIDVQCAEFTAGFQYYSLLSNELAEQATLKGKNTEYKRTSKDERRQFLVSPSLIIPAEPKLQSWQGRGLWRVAIAFKAEVLEEEGR